ncbi:MAG TPA: TetR/AcrR family transcriptional regulator [Frankiaceae bacterium]|nr:TetR/AcrR family transcriptional regulator [Frankiaceae bacterium]
MTALEPTVANGIARGVGRPRSSPSQRFGMSGREQILDAAGRMFSEQGYGAASTRKIAMAVGVKQASLYYHFESKEDILAGLLAGTVEPSLEFAKKLSRTREPAHVQLYALTYFDVSLLASARWNVGALYHLPELRADRFAVFREDRQQLKRAYGRRVISGQRAGIFTVNSVDVATSLVFALAESGIAMRSDELTLNPKLPELTAASCLRLLSCGEDLLEAAAAANQRLQLLAPTIAD